MLELNTLAWRLWKMREGKKAKQKIELVGWDVITTSYIIISCLQDKPRCSGGSSVDVMLVTGMDSLP